PQRRVMVEDEIRIAVEQPADNSRAEFRVRADSAQQQPDQLADVSACWPRAQKLIELLLGRDAEMTLICVRDSRFLHLHPSSCLLRFIRGTQRRQRRAM